MGCDIHFHVERRTDEGWDHVPNPGGVDYYRTDKWYDGRNYDLFAILAGVRNGRGFAGVKTGKGFVPIFPPRGLPNDVSPAVREDSNEWGVDGHSHSHLTVAEVLAYDWDQDATLTRLFKCNEEQAARIQRFADTYHEIPDWKYESAAGVSGSSEHVAQWQRVTWTQPYYRCVSADWWGTVARAVRLSKGSLDDVRFVFWFDN